LYEDDDYYDDYEEEPVVTKKQAAVSNTKTKQPVTNVQANKQKQNAPQKIQTATKQPAKIEKSTTSSIKPQEAKVEKEKINDSKISLEMNKLSINEVNKKHHDKHQPRTVQELNELKYPKINYNLENNSEKLENISVVIIGHVDSGKSTLMGHLLYLQGQVTDKDLQKYEKESKKIGKSTFHFAWAMDEGTEERKRGVTFDIAYKYFETKTKKVTVMDAPGHRDFIPNMMTGTSAADVALLVIDANKNAFETGFFLGGQTKEHAILAKSLGVKQIIICVNKLELMDWSKERYDYIEAQVRDYLNSLNFDDKDIFFIPVSGLLGVNLNKIDQSITKLNWYTGKTLIEIIDLLDNPVREYEAPVRFAISDVTVTTINFLQGVGIFGKLETGAIFEDQEYLIEPVNIKTKIRSIAVDNIKTSSIKAGQSGELLLNLDKTMIDDIRPGFVLCSHDYPIPVVTSIRAHIITLDIKAPLSFGQTLFVHSKNQKTQAKIKKIEKIFSKDGKTTKLNTV